MILSLGQKQLLLVAILDNLSLAPRFVFVFVFVFFFKKVEIFIPLEVYTYEVTTCSILLGTSAQLIKLDFFLSVANFKSRVYLVYAAF